MCACLHVKYPFLLSYVNEPGTFSTDFRKKNLKYQNFMKRRPIEIELFHVDGRMDGRTDRLDETNNRFSQFCEGD